MKLYNYHIIIEYLGTNYVGWQKQKNGRSIQSEIEKVIKKFFPGFKNLNGSGRTDAGVHATGQSANFYSYLYLNKEKRFKILKSLNFFLKKKNITILSMQTKKKNFHARFSAKERTYNYVIVNRVSSLTLDNNRAWHVKKKLNLSLMKKGIKYFLGTHDFTAYRSSSCTSKSPIRTIKKAYILKKKDKIFIKFSSPSFLQQQVRSMVGCIKTLGEGKWDIKKFKTILELKKRSLCATPAPPHGLYLEEVKY